MAPPSDENEDVFGTGGSKNKPCRTCNDFKSWSKMQKASLKSTKDNKKENPAPTHLDRNGETQRQCPVDKDELGRSTWTFLHTMAAYYPSKPTTTESQEMQHFIGLFSKFYPCNVCAEDMQNEIKVAPPNTSSQSTLSRWFCDLHNKVNAKLGKPIFDCNRVNERWRDGPSDGSCD